MHSDMADHWQPLKALVAGWHPPLTGEDAIPLTELDAAEARLGLALPVALKEWHHLMGKRLPLLANQDYFVTPEQFEIEYPDQHYPELRGENLEAGLLDIYVENQGVVTWAIRVSDFHLPDPPVLLVTPGEQAEVESATLSEYALQRVIFETIAIAPFRVENTFHGSVHDTIEQNYSRFQAIDWHWPDYPTRFFQGDNVLIVTSGLEHNTWVSAGAKSREAYEHLKNLIAAHADSETSNVFEDE